MHCFIYELSVLNIDDWLYAEIHIYDLQSDDIIAKKLVVT